MKANGFGGHLGTIKQRRNRSRFAQAERNQSSLRDASDGAAENITFQRESAKSLTSGTSVPKKRSQRTRAAFFFLLLLSVRAEEVPCGNGFFLARNTCRRLS